MDIIVTFVGGGIGGILVTYIPYLFFSFFCKQSNLTKILLLKNTFCLLLFFLWFLREGWTVEWYARVSSVLLLLYAGLYWLLNIRTKKPTVVFLLTLIDFLVASSFGIITAGFILSIKNIMMGDVVELNALGILLLFFLPVSALSGGISGAVVSNIMLSRVFDNEKLY